ncbi:MAG: DUF996 domain-containing protein [Candidatus Methanomethylicaceae archaeon]
MSLETAKTLSGIGSLLIALGYLVPFLGIIGIIILLIGLKEFSNYYNEPKIFKNAFYGFIFGLIGIIAAGFTFFSIFILSRAIETMIMRLFIPFIFSSLIIFIFYLLKAIFYKKAFNLIYNKSGEELFNIVGILLLIGAVLTIIVIGLIIMFIAWIIATIAFLFLKPKAVL